MNKGPNYEVVDVSDVRVLIRDVGPWDKHLTVTNAVEEVARQMAPLLNGRRLFYIDSEGRTDEIMVVDGEFAGFNPGRD